jgi:predicted nuclease of restriction endonuclease-like (RecB) superfamily
VRQLEAEPPEPRTRLSWIANLILLNQLKDPYTFDFLTLGEAAQERDLERRLVEHVQKLLLEMGAGFAFVGRQVHVEVGDEEFYGKV